MADQDALETIGEAPEFPLIPPLSIDRTAASIDRSAAARYLADLSGEGQMAAFIDFVIAGLLPRDHRAVFWGDRLLTLDKSAGFLREPRFAAAFAAIMTTYEYDQYRSPQGISWRLHTLTWAANAALALPSADFVECGVFKGDMSWVIGQVTEFAATGRRFHLYDSFAGFDPALSSAGDFPDAPGFYDFAQRTYSTPGLYEDVTARFREMPCFCIHPGFLPAALDHAGAPDRIGFLHIDLNSPAAEIACLERLFDRVIPGGMIVLDDYGWSLYRAQKQAEDAFFAERGYLVLELPTGQGLVVKR